MANIVKSYTIPEANIPELVSAFGYDWVEFLDEEQTVPNPQSKQAYASQQFDKYVIDSIKRYVRRYRVRLAKQSLQDDFGIS